MSLAGNLSDLSLPELLQVVALSRKTGALEICSEQGGVAWLGLRDGGIVRVALEDGDLDRDELLRKAGMEDAGSDVVEAMLWDAAVQAILRIFDWSEGDFTFEPLDDPAIQWRGPQGILLPSPLSPEFLALEGARLEDESAGAAEADVEFAREPEREQEPEPEPEPEPEFEAREEPDAEPEPEFEAEPEPEPELEPEPEFERVVERDPPTLVAAPRPSAPIVEPPPPEPPAPVLEFVVPPRSSVPDADPTMIVRDPLNVGEGRAPAAKPSVLICVDVDLPLLEKLKNGLAGEAGRIHIFQNASDALTRFKQYVVRGEVPALIVGSMIEDPLDAHQGLGWRRFAGRLLGIAPRLRLVVLARPGENVAAPGLAVVRRPEPRNATLSDYQHLCAQLGRALAASA